VLIRTKILCLSDRRPSRGQNFLVCPTESRAEPNLSDCPKSARLGFRLGSRALFRTISDDFGQSDSRIPESPRTKIKHYQSLLIKIYLNRALYSIYFYKSLNFQSIFMIKAIFCSKFIPKFSVSSSARLCPSCPNEPNVRNKTKSPETGRVSEIRAELSELSDCPKGVRAIFGGLSDRKPSRGYFVRAEPNCPKIRMSE
jgi:hypothetical protein